jgi:CheY-like chemotaxis protein
LGLAISRKFALLMGGDITVTSQLGQGSIFRFEIPVGRGDSGVALKQPALRRVKALQNGVKAPKILVVDDNADNRDWLTKLLTAVGFTAREADDGVAAIHHWEDWNPDLILMDVHMPVLDGLAATRRIKADPRGKDTPIVVLTASALDGDRREVAQSGADDFVAKPCREDELLEKIRALLDISYEYQETSAAEAPTQDGIAALAAALGQLPIELVEELRNATAAGNKKLLDKLILRVPDTGGGDSALALQALADKYEYDTLSQLLEEACRR